MIKLFLTLSVGFFFAPFFVHANTVTLPASYWKFDEVSVSTGTSTDSGSNGFDLLVNSNSSRGGTGKINAGLTAGSSGSAQPNSNQVLNQTNLGDWSINLWANPTTETGSNQMMVSKGLNQYNILLNASTEKVGVAIPGVAGIVTGNALGTGTFQMITLVHQGGTPDDTWILYQNGIQTAINTTNTNAMSSNSLKFTVGGEAGGSVTSQFQGVIDELGFWTTYALKPAEITALYNAGVGCQYTFGLCPYGVSAFIPWQFTDF